jgi:hypothetical protein
MACSRESQGSTVANLGVQFERGLGRAQFAVQTEVGQAANASRFFDLGRQAAISQKVTSDLAGPLEHTIVAIQLSDFDFVRVNVLVVL